MSSAPAPTPDEARRDAVEILNGKKFHPKSGPRPLRGALRWLGDVFSWIGDKLYPLGRPFVWLWQHTLGWLSAPMFWIVLIAVIVTIIVFVARHFQQREIARALRGHEQHTMFGEEPDTRTIEELDAAAAAAESTGDYAMAVRLRFRAGLLRLERDAEAIVLRPGLTTREVRTTLQSQRFDDLANTFESIAYGGQSAVPEAANEAKRQWPVVVQEAST